MRSIIIFLINIYQKTFSPDHGPMSFLYPHGFCRYSPSCSQYCKEAVSKYGSLKGLYLGIKRVLRCNPWASFGPDPIP